MREHFVIEIGEYSLKTGSGKHIRNATFVKYSSGIIIRFAERCSKKWALQNARELLLSPYYEPDYS